VTLAADIEHFDLVVVGAGPAGEKAAAQAAYFGKSVAIVERDSLPGGAAVHSGGVPTKTLRETALYITGFKQRDVYGVGLQLDLAAALSHLHSRAGHVVRTITSAVSENIARHGIELIQGSARLGPNRSIQVERADGATRSIRAGVILLATGSRPFHPPGVPFEDEDVLDSDSVMEVDKPFESVVVVGGGAVGCEYASIFAALGIGVTVVDNGPRLVPFMDAELSDLLAESFRRMGVRVLLKAGRAGVARDAGGLKVSLEDGEVIRPAKVLFAAGRAGNTEDLGLAAAGVATDERGRILVDERFQTRAEGIYAAGDVIGPPALASVSMEQGRVAICHAFGIPFKQAVDELAPFGIYSIPEVAMVGMSEEAALLQGLDYEVGRAWFARNTRATIAGATDGLLKLVFRRNDRRLLGVHILGSGAAELIHLGQAALHFSGTIDYFIDTTFNVPTSSEAFKYAAYDGLQRLQASAPRQS
jgi:NAD(P) transhydrogenase